MQPPGPPRPFRGSQYDKDMFTFLPAGLNRDVLPESSRKRKLTSSDYQMTSSAPSNLRRGNSNHQLNNSDSQGERALNSTLALRSSESSSFRGLPGQSQYWHQNTERQDCNERVFYEPRSGYTPFSTQLQSRSEGGTKKMLSLPPPVIEDFNEYGNREPNSHLAAHKGSNWTPLLTEDINWCENHDSNAHAVAHKPLDWQPPVIQGSNKHEDRESNAVIVVPTSSNFPPSTTEDSLQHGKRDLNAHVMTHKTSNPLLTQDMKHYESRELNAHVQPRAIASDLYERASNILAELQKVNVSNPRAVSGVLEEKGRREEETYKVDHPSDVSRIEIGSVSGIDSDKTFGPNTGTSVYNLQTETNNLLNVLRLLSAASGIGIPENNDVKIMKSTPDSAIHHLNHPPQEESTLSKKDEDGQNLGIPAEHVEKGSVKVDGSSKLDEGASSLAEKLWDGTLKLSTSVLVSVVAIFKSGEKMLDISWSDIVEVKGKVRLEAFEKYLHDLPRSRSRGLMVTSLCCKEGSSDAGHKGMKEVAKKYKGQKKVGFAKLSTDVDLYICPHSDAIITIITKNGFCKGMTYVEDQNVPLIGCVVWKKNSSSSHSKHAEVLTAEKEETSIRGVEINKREKSPEFRHSPGSQNGSTSGKLSEIKTDVEINKPVLNIPSFASKTSVDDDDDDDNDDDLPEYDFRAALSQASVSKTSEIEAPKPNSEGPTPKNLEQQSEVKKPSLPVQEQKPIEKGLESLKRRNLFDDDDMPEWCPPDLGKKREEATKSVEPSNSLSHSIASTSGFADLTSGVMLPPPPSPPPLTHMQLQGKNHPLTQFQLQGKSQSSAPRVHPPPLPVTQMQGNNNQFVHLSKPPAIGFKPETPASMSTQLPLNDGKYPFAPHVPPRPAPLTDKASSNGLNNEYPAFPPGFTPNPAFRPRFDLPVTKNAVRPSTWSRRP